MRYIKNTGMGAYPFMLGHHAVFVIKRHVVSGKFTGFGSPFQYGRYIKRSVSWCFSPVIRVFDIEFLKGCLLCFFQCADIKALDHLVKQPVPVHFGL